MTNKQKDTGMKWVIIADIMIALVVALLVTASYIERNVKKQEAENIAKASTQTSTSTSAPKNYDFDINITPLPCPDTKSNLDIVLITDENYIPYTQVAIKSAILAKCPQNIYNFHIMTLDVTQSSQKELQSLAEENVNINILEQQEVDLFYIRGTHVSKTSLLKYYIANVLPNVDKALYIDSDTLILQDLTNLYNTDIENKYLAAVKDPSWFFENYHVKELGLEYRGFYFNSGVMLMNLKKIRDDNFIQALEEYTNNNYRTYMDQDALNVLVKNDVVLLDVEYNTMNFFFDHNPIDVLAKFYNRQWQNYEDVFKNATIIHFASSKKPLSATVNKTEFFYMLQKLWHRYYKNLNLNN